MRGAWCGGVRNLNGLNGWIADMFGKPQSWFDRVGRDQREITMLRGEVSAIGRSAWDALQLRLAEAIAQGYQMPVDRFPGFQWIMDDLEEQIKNLLITGDEGWLFKTTTGKIPTDEQISTAESRISTYRAAVDYARRILPEVAPAMDEEVARISSMLPDGSLRSPAEVGEETFKAELKRRADVLGGGFGTAAMVLLGIVAAFMGWRMSR